MWTSVSPWLAADSAEAKALLTSALARIARTVDAAAGPPWLATPWWGGAG